MTRNVTFDLPSTGASIPREIIAEALNELDSPEAAVYVRNGLDGSYLIVSKVYVDLDGDLIFLVT